jgi:5-methylcytosine-specific restriction endonuclease McrA
VSAETHSQALASIVKTQDRVIKFYEKRIAELTRLAREQADLIAWMDDKHEGFYQSAAWLELRQRVLDTYGARCMRCGTTPQDGAVRSRSTTSAPRRCFLRWRSSFDNLQPLCRQCNLGKGFRDMTDYRPKGEANETESSSHSAGDAREPIEKCGCAANHGGRPQDRWYFTFMRRMQNELREVRHW